MAGKGIYATMKFPPYQYREYPKAVKANDGTTRIVASQREEMAVMAEPKPEAAPSAETLAAQLSAAQARTRDLEAALAAERAKGQKAAVVPPKVGPVGTEKAPAKA